MLGLFPRLMIATLGFAPLLGCGGDGTNPFIIDSIPAQDTTSDPNTGADATPDNRFLFSPSENLILNSVDFDETTNQLVLNNLPFDNSDITGGIYEQVQQINARTIEYRNERAGDQPFDTYYAVFIRSPEYEATAVASGDYLGFGYGGANLRRIGNTITLPGVATYTYAGDYAGYRTFDQGRGGIELVTGDIRIDVDFADIDVVENIGGTLRGAITNRQRAAPGGGAAIPSALPNVLLVDTEFNRDGEINEAEAGTAFEGDPRDSGIYDGGFNGEDAAAVAGFIKIEGVAGIQRVGFDTVTYSQVIDGQAQLFTQTSLPNDLRDVRERIGRGQVIADFAFQLPAGATLVERETDTIVLSSEFNAREVGVFSTDSVNHDP